MHNWANAFNIQTNNIMTKKYIAKSHVAINVVLPSGKSHHVSFLPLTGGGSMFITDSEALQKALEAHRKFGKLFKIDISYKDEPEQTEEPQEQDAEVVAVKKVEVASLDDAKNYLVDNFDISRTKLRSKKQIEDAAAANGIEFSFE